MPRRIGRTVLVSVLAAWAGFVSWDRLVKPHVLPKRFGEVTPGQIYRSGKLTPATMSAVVRENGIKTVIDLGAWVDNPRGERLEDQTCRVLGVERHVFDLIGDSTGDPNDYVEALRLMTASENQPVLVHCGAGTERTGAVVYFYRTIVEGKPSQEALAEARRAGHDPRRNPRLNETIERWSAEIARAYREGGRIEFDAGGGGPGGRASDAVRAATPAPSAGPDRAERPGSPDDASSPPAPVNEEPS